MEKFTQNEERIEQLQARQQEIMNAVSAMTAPMPREYFDIMAELDQLYDEQYEMTEIMAEQELVRRADIASFNHYNHIDQEGEKS